MDTREQLIQDLDEAYRAFLSVVEGLDEHAFEQKWLDNRWGVRELAAHIAGWHGKLASGMERMARGERPVPRGENWSDTQSYNDVFAEHAKGKQKDQVLYELDAAVESFKEAARNLPDERFRNGATASKMFEGAGISHFREHAAQVRNWKEKERLVGAGAGRKEAEPPRAGMGDVSAG